MWLSHYKCRVSGTVDRTLHCAITKLLIPLYGIPQKLINWTFSFFSCPLNPFCPYLFFFRKNKSDHITHLPKPLKWFSTFLMITKSLTRELPYSFFIFQSITSIGLLFIEALVSLAPATCLISGHSCLIVCYDFWLSFSLSKVPDIPCHKVCTGGCLGCSLFPLLPT